MFVFLLRLWARRGRRDFPALCTLALLALSSCASLAAAKASVTLYPVPQEVRSNHYVVMINGRKTPVVHAASSYYLLNFDTGSTGSGPLRVSVTADDPHFWDRGVEVQPMRLGIRPVRHGATITFSIAGPGKLSISRPGDHFADADMLFLFANPPDTSRIGPNTPGVRYYGPGVHRESIDAQSGDTIYLAGGAVVFGSLNIWQVHDVHVLGRGMIVYDGPQNPADDDGWMHKRNWHAIVMDNARNIEIDGITTVVRSRTWQIQMKDSRNIGFYNVKVVAGTKGDANQDGMDWLGGGDTTVRDSFFRASDDVFALQGNWEGYSEQAFKTPGHDVTNISIENSVVSTSISNTIRVGWPQKIFSSAHFEMSNMDVLQTGYGDCKVPFAFFELWADPDGVGSHADYRFQDIRLEDWYSLFQIRYPQPRVRDVHFSGLWAMDGPGMVPSALKGDVRDVQVQDVAETEGRSTEVLDGAETPEIKPAAIDAGYHYTAGLLRPREPVTFTANAPEAARRKFAWMFGDGTSAEGREVRHTFADAQGTLLDGSGRFRVLLHVIDRDGVRPSTQAFDQAWKSESVVLSSHPLAPVASPTVATASPHMVERMIRVPADGGYTFTVLVRGGGHVQLDNLAPVANPAPRARVCGSTESAAQPVRISAGLLAGMHRLRMEMSGEMELPPVVLWEGPGLPRQLLPAAAP